MQQILSDARLALRRALWHVDRRVKRTFLYDKTQSHALSLRPLSTRIIVVERLPAGEFSISVRHTDSFVANSRKSLLLTIEAPGQSAHDTAELGKSWFALDERRAATYLGGGRWRGRHFEHIVKATLRQPKGFVKLTIVSLADRYINLDDLRFERTRANAGEAACGFRIDHAALEALLTRRPGLASATAILYADIDLNVVDGSSVWLSSMATMISQSVECIVVCKRDIASDIVISNINAKKPIHFIEPRDLGAAGRTFSAMDCVGTLAQLDDRLPLVRRVFVRGLIAAEMLHATRRYFDRSVVYITDFYTIRNGERILSEESRRQLQLVMRQTAITLTQTSAIASAITEASGVERPFTLTPPAAPDSLPNVSFEPTPGGPLRIGYAGKVNPDWGLIELFEWTRRLRDEEGLATEVVIVANKISPGALTGSQASDFLDRMRVHLSEDATAHHDNLNREGAMREMMRADFIWCYRPARLEEHTLELSTKLVEMIAFDKPCLCYPSAQNKDALGKDYPFFVKSYEDFRALVAKGRVSLDNRFARRIREQHSISAIAATLAQATLPAPAVTNPPKLGAAVHDPKFIDAFLSSLKAKGVPLMRDDWAWGEAGNLDRSRKLLDWADIIFCEWGLANAVWFSQNNYAGKKLFVRMHLQEIKERAQKFGAALNLDAVTKVIFVSEQVRDAALELWRWPKEKTVIIPNYVLDNEYTPKHKPRAAAQINLGMVGIIPQRKRMDRGVETLSLLVEAGEDAHLYIKGPRPEELDFMRAESRAHELVYYQDVYADIERRGLSKRVHFEGWGNDVALWYGKIDVILSPSEFESFHYALADGVLAGCRPIVWPWEEAERIYSPDWVVADAQEAAHRIMREQRWSVADRAAAIELNRNLVVDRYGRTRIFAALEREIFGAPLQQ